MLEDRTRKYYHAAEIKVGRSAKQAVTCACMYACVNVCPSACPSVCQSVRPCVRPSDSPSFCPSVCPYVCPSVQPSVHPSVHARTVKMSVVRLEENACTVVCYGTDMHITAVGLHHRTSSCSSHEEESSDLVLGLTHVLLHTSIVIILSSDHPRLIG